MGVANQKEAPKGRAGAGPGGLRVRAARSSVDLATQIVAGQGLPAGSRVSPGVAMNLQRLAGNTAVARLLAAPAADPVQVSRWKGDSKLVPTAGKTAWEVTKPSLFIGGAAGGALSSGNFGVGSGVIGGANVLNAGLTIHSGRARRDQALRSGDRAGVSIGQGGIRAGGWGMMGGVTGTTQAGLSTAKTAGSSLAGLSAGIGGLSVAGGGITALQGLWRVYKAVGKLSDLATRSMKTRDGERWKERVGNREKWKLGMGALKVALGVLGIAAGALVIASNPVGWALGIAAAVAGGAWALTKIGHKVRDLWARRQKKKEIKKRDPDGYKTKEARKLADEVARECSTNAKVAGEMIGALSTGQPDVVIGRNRAINRMSRTRGRASSVILPTPGVDDYRAYDAVSLLAVLNIPPDEALSSSGQERVEKKLSVSESA